MKTTDKTMNANQLINALTYAEVDAQYAPDARRMITSERMSLQIAVRSGDGAKIAAAMEESRRVANMWGVTI